VKEDAAEEQVSIMLDPEMFI
jgi:translation initiation factor 4E